MSNPSRLLSVQAEFLAKVKEWPVHPGVYVMRDAAKRILYVGKAKNLRNRIRTYFLNPDAMTPKTRVMVQRIADVEFTVTNTELDALLLECNLIKKHRPRFNIRLKDDKNFPYVVLDFTHPFPQFRVTRKVVFAPELRYFGPFSGGIREISRFLLKTFQIRDCSESKFRNRTRPCLNYEIGTCTAPCVNLVSQEDYAKQIREAILFLKGKKQVLIQALKKEMYAHSENTEYERARLVRDKIEGIERLTEKQDAVLVDKLKDIDVIGCFIAQHEVQWVTLFVRNGFLTGRRAERVRITLNPEESIRQFVEQFYSVSLIPDEIWMMDDFPDREGLQDLFSQQSGKEVRIHVKRGEKALRLLGMAQENARLIFEEGKRKGTESATEELQRVLNLPDLPHSIEGIDVSNFQGTSAAVALVHFADERPLKSRYRLYYPRTVEGANDFASIHEIVTRRFSKPDPPPPELLLIDGGKGQLAAAVKALEEIGVSIPVCSLAKARTESGFTRKDIKRSDERIFIPGRKNPIVLRQGNPALALLMRVRDEAHRFSVVSHRRRRGKWSASGPLEEIKGVGMKTKEKLLKKFGSLEAIAKADPAELKSLGVSQKVVEKLLTALKPKSSSEE